jgi:translation initiation factor 1A
MGDFGDFEETVDEQPQQEQQNGEPVVPTRLRMPRGKEIIGVVEQRLGGNRMEVKCSDNKTRNCRVPGRFKRSFWIRAKDIVLVEPWEGDNEKADIVFHYQKGAVNQLRKRGLLSQFSDSF